MVQYIIKVYKIKNMTCQEHSTILDLEYLSDLPYVWSEKPINICNQLNEMFENFEHMICVK